MQGVGRDISEALSIGFEVERDVLWNLFQKTLDYLFVHFINAQMYMSHAEGENFCTRYFCLNIYLAVA